MDETCGRQGRGRRRASFHAPPSPETREGWDRLDVLEMAKQKGRKEGAVARLRFGAMLHVGVGVVAFTRKSMPSRSEKGCSASRGWKALVDAVGGDMQRRFQWEEVFLQCCVAWRNAFTSDIVCLVVVSAAPFLPLMVA
jgi:hypothetical protein